MIVTNEIAAQRIGAYIRHEITLEELVDWAESALMDAEFEPEYAAALAEVAARLGVADVKEFGLSWEDCEALLAQLGYQARVDIVAR